MMYYQLNKEYYMIPTCNTCGDSGNGILFPLFPKSADKGFGDICKDCDEEATAEA